jgi:hypothetical protein
MNPICAAMAVVIALAFTAVNLFIPYALLVLLAAGIIAAAFGIPCGIFSRGRQGECRLGYC